MFLSQSGSVFKRKSIRKRSDLYINAVAPTVTSNTEGKKMFENFKKVSFLYQVRDSYPFQPQLYFYIDLTWSINFKTESFLLSLYEKYPLMNISFISTNSKMQVDQFMERNPKLNQKFNVVFMSNNIMRILNLQDDQFVIAINEKEQVVFIESIVDVLQNPKPLFKLLNKLEVVSAEVIRMNEKGEIKNTQTSNLQNRELGLLLSGLQIRGFDRKISTTQTSLMSQNPFKAQSPILVNNMQYPMILPKNQNQTTKTTKSMADALSSGRGSLRISSALSYGQQKTQVELTTQSKSNIFKQRPQSAGSGVSILRDAVQPLEEELKRHNYSVGQITRNAVIKSREYVRDKKINFNEINAISEMDIELSDN